MTKKIRLRSPGVSSATRVASSNCFGCARRNGAQKSSSRSCAPTASAISLRPWPADTQNRPDDASMILSPRSFHRYIPSARTTICGSALNSRFGVNGIQYSSSEMRFVAAWSWIVSSAWPIVVSFASSARVRAGRWRPARRVLGSTPNRTPLRPECGGTGAPRRPPRCCRGPEIHPNPILSREIPCASASRKRSRSSKIASASCRAACASSRRTATPSSSSAMPGRASAWTTTRTARRARPSSPRPPRCSPPPT